MSFEITGFDHMVLKCRDLDKALWFYGEVLGMEVLRLDHYQSELRFPSVRVSDGILIDLPPDNSRIHRRERRPLLPRHLSHRHGGPAERTARKGLGSGGARGPLRLRRSGNGCSSRLKDPNGHKLELRCYP